MTTPFWRIWSQQTIGAQVVPGIPLVEGTPFDIFDASDFDFMTGDGVRPWSLGVMRVRDPVFGRMLAPGEDGLLRIRRPRPGMRDYQVCRPPA